MDKWLWAARFFKTRALASRACDLGRIQLAGQPVKPAREVRPGDCLRVTTEGGAYEIEVLALSEVRGPAAAAQLLYRESDESHDARQRAAAERKALWQAEGGAPAPGHGRPTKRDRRRIIRFRDWNGQR